MGDHYLQLLLLLHPVNTILNHRQNQVCHASVCRCLNSLVQSLYTSIYLYKSIFPPSLNVLQKLKKIIYFFICSTTATEIFCSLGSTCYLVFFIFVRQFIFEVQIFKSKKHMYILAFYTTKLTQFLNGIETLLQVRTF